MASKQLFIAYCNSNNDIADLITRRFHYISFDHIEYPSISSPLSISEQILEKSIPGILIISHQFLVSRECINKTLDVFLNPKMPPIKTIMVGESDEEKVISTRFEKISTVLYYMNFWQNEYRTLKDAQTDLPLELLESYKNKLHKIRNISRDIGEFLRQLRKQNPINFNLLTRSNYIELEPFVKSNSLIDEDLEEVEKKKETKASKLIKKIIDHNSPNVENAIEVADKNKLKTNAKDQIRNMLNKMGDKDKPSKRNFEFENPAEKKIPELITANQLIANRKYVEAENLLKDYLRKEPGNIKGNFVLANLYAKKMSTPEKAIPHLQIISTDKDYALLAFLNLAEIAEAKNDFNQGLRYYKKAFKLFPDNAKLNYKFGLLYIKLGTEYNSKAKEHLSRAINKNPKNVDAHFQLGTLAQYHYDFELATKYYEKVMELSPRHPFAAFELAICYQQIGSYEQAQASFEKAVENNSDYENEQNRKRFFSKEKNEPNQNGITKSTGSSKYDKLDLERPLSPTFSEVIKTTLNKPIPKKVKTVLITGATSGIGKATARAFAKDGARLILTGRRIQKLEDIFEELKDEYNSDILLLNFDIRDKNYLSTIKEKLGKKWANIDILINNAGLALGMDPIHQGNIDHWEAMIDTNLKGLLYVSRSISPIMVAQNGGHIINVASIAGKEVYPLGNVYNATKHAVDALTRAMRLDLVDYNIRVSQVAPGHVEDTEFAKVRFEGDEKRAKIYNDFNPITSTDVANTIFYIANQPPHVNICDVTIMGTQQASATKINRSGRIFD